MPVRGLPGNANVEQLKKGAKGFQRAVLAGDAGAAEIVREFHPRLADAQPGSPELAQFKRTDAQLVIARQFGFPSWPKLRAHLELVAAYSRAPHLQPIGGPIEDEAARIDELLRLACLNYGADDPGRWASARKLLEAHPELATATIHTMAAVGEAAAARELLRRDPSQARARGGPYDWEPLLYVTYSRLGETAPGRSAVETARALLGAGADPNAGYLWEGLVPPFTALTGALGGGEGNPPAHGDELALARLLLEAGADPNDGQALYNRHWDPDDRWLELLLEFGLGTGDGGPWKRLLGDAQMSPQAMLDDELMGACREGFQARVKLLLEHGADPDGGSRHRIYGGRTPMQEAAFWGHTDIMETLRAAGARDELDPVERFLALATAGDRAEVERLLATDPSLRDSALAKSPTQIIGAASTGRVEGVRLLIELGFDVGAVDRSTPLHEAALRGNLEIIDLLLAHGADPNQVDMSYNATPAGWAEHGGMREAYARLSALEDRA